MPEKEEKERKKEKDVEYQEAAKELLVDIRTTRTMMIGLFVVAMLFRFLLGLEFPIVIIYLVAAVVIFYFFYEGVIQRTETTKQLYNMYFWSNVLDLSVLSVIIYYLGGVEWVGGFFYAFTLVLGGIILPRAKNYTLGFLALVLYLVVVVLDYTGVLPHQSLFTLYPDIYKNPRFVITQVFATFLVLFFLVKSVGDFSEMFRKKREELKKERERTERAYLRAEHARKILEVRVRARTRELRRLTEKQEEIIEERTEELKKRIKELEKFRRLVVGREMKMIELKKEIKELKREKKELESNNDK